MRAFWNTTSVAASSRSLRRFDRVSARVVIDSSTDSSSAPTANASVIRARSPSRRTRRSRRAAPDARTSDLELVAQAPDRDDVPRVRRIGLDLRAEAPNVHVDESPVAEVAIAPDALEQDLPAEHAPGALGELDEHAELGLGEVHVPAVATHDALVRHDLQVAEAEVRRADLRGAGAAQEGADPGGQLLG